MNENLTQFLTSLPPRRIALEYRDQRMTVGDLSTLSARAAAALRARGIGPGDRVGLWLPNVPAWLVLFFACARLGAIAVAVNTRFRASEVGDIVGRAGCKVLALWPGFKAIDFVGILRQIEPAALLPLEHLIVYGEDEPVRVEMPGVARVTAYADLLAAAPDTAPPAPADARCVIFTTSGTTSAPKFVCHVQGAVVHHARDVARAFGFDTPGALLLQAIPLCGVFGFTQAQAALAAGAPMITLPVFQAEEAATLLRARGVTHMCGGDEMMDRMLAVVPENPPFPTLRYFAYASFNPALDDIAERADARGVVMRGLYGMSECHALFAVQPQDAPLAERRKGGGLPVSPQAAVRVCDPETGVVLPTGEQGELQLRGPSVMHEYFGNPTATAAAFTADGFFRTGDLGYLEGDGRFCYVARMGDVLRLAGFLTSPQEIEAVIDAHADVFASQVIGLTLQGQPQAVAFVIPQAGAVVDPAALQAWCAGRLAGYKVPRHVFVIDEFPTTPSANGTKIQRAKLRDVALARLSS